MNPLPRQHQRHGDEPAGQWHVLLGHRQPKVDGGGDLVELLRVGGGAVVAAGGLRDCGQLVRIQSCMELIAVDLDSRSVCGANADGLDV